MTETLSFNIQHPIMTVFLSCCWQILSFIYLYSILSKSSAAKLFCLRKHLLGAALEEFLIKDVLPKAHQQTDMPHDLGEYKAGLCLMIPFFKDLIRKESSFY